MEKQKMENFIYQGLGFPIILVNAVLVKKWGIWTPAIDYNKLQKEVFLALSHKLFPLTGHEVHFIRAYLKMTLEELGKFLDLSRATILKWERFGNKPAKINPLAELCLRSLMSV